MTVSEIVIVGGGHAAAQVCNGLVEAGLGDRIHLITAEPELPYHRPPLSKAFLRDAKVQLSLHRDTAWFEKHGVTVHLGDPARWIDRNARRVQLRSGTSVPYSRLVLATGAAARQFSALPAPLANVFNLRTAMDARALREACAAVGDVTILGGGFIGLEVAAALRASGKNVCVLEAASRLLARAVSPEMSAHILTSHQANGTEVVLGADVSDFEIADNTLRACLVNGVRRAISVLVLGIGATPDTTLAEQAGLACQDGVVVDRLMRTSDLDILAVGDCTRYPDSRSERSLRLESVQNANAQARTAVATLLGREEPYAATPWFWSDQGGLRLQMVGLAPAAGVRRMRPAASDGGFSIAHYDDGRLVCVESANAPQDHLVMRRLLEGGHSLSAAQFSDTEFPLTAALS